MDLKFLANDQTLAARVEQDGAVVVLGPEENFQARVKALPGGGFSIQDQDGTAYGTAAAERDRVWVRWRGRTYVLEVQRGSAGRAKTRGAGDLSSPMPGQVVKHLKSPGDQVHAGEALLVVEAMKMQLEIKAPSAGVIKSYLFEEGGQIDAGVPLVDLEPAS